MSLGGLGDLLYGDNWRDREHPETPDREWAAGSETKKSNAVGMRARRAFGEALLVPKPPGLPVVPPVLSQQYYDALWEHYRELIPSEKDRFYWLRYWLVKATREDKSYDGWEWSVDDAGYVSVCPTSSRPK